MPLRKRSRHVASASAVLLACVAAAQTRPGIFRIQPVRPVDELRATALAAKPPAEPGSFRKSDLVDLAALDPHIKLDIRYATSDNFLSTPVYSSARAFMQRPAAEALLRAHRELATQGYGLLIFDAYRPWYVTRIFWDATPPDKHEFVANPAEGSRHNRGCAVDLSLYDLKTGREIEMTGVYDEMSERSYPDYAGGTAEQRAHRQLLRRAMEKQGFTVFPSEWWHFDYRDWKEYAIQNVPFETIANRRCTFGISSRPRDPAAKHEDKHKARGASRCDPGGAARNRRNVPFFAGDAPPHHPRQAQQAGICAQSRGQRGCYDIEQSHGIEQAPDAGQNPVREVRRPAQHTKSSRGLTLGVKWLQPGGHYQHGSIVRNHSQHHQPNLPYPVRFEAPDHRPPVAKVENAGKQKVAGTGKEVPCHRKYEEVAGSRSVAPRPKQEDPEDRDRKHTSEGAIRRNPSRLNIALQRDRAHGHAMGSAQPRRYPVAQPFVQNIRSEEHTSEL